MYFALLYIYLHQVCIIHVVIISIYINYIFLNIFLYQFVFEIEILL